MKGYSRDIGVWVNMWLIDPAYSGTRQPKATIKTVRTIRHQTFFEITIECCYQRLMCVITHSGIYSGHLLQHDP